MFTVTKMDRYLYRFVRDFYEYEEDQRVLLCSFKILRNTPKGFWIEYKSSTKWVSSDGKNRFAFPTQKEAIFNFIKRTERCIRIQKMLITRSISFLNEATEIEKEL